MVKDISNLFINVSKILKDEVILELKKQNEFLQKLIYKKNKIYIGKKVEFYIPSEYIQLNSIIHKYNIKNGICISETDDNNYKILVKNR